MTAPRVSSSALLIIQILKCSHVGLCLNVLIVRMYRHWHFLSSTSRHDLVLRNTFFDHKDIHLATWTGPGDRNADQIDLMVMRRAQAKAIVNCRVHRGAELETDHYLLVSSCRLQLSQPRATRSRVRVGYDSGLLHDAAIQSKYAQMVSDETCILSGMVDLPDSTPETIWQQYKSGLQHCADAVLHTEAQPRAPWISDQTWAYVQRKQNSYKALKHAESEHEKAILHKQYRQALNDCRKSVKLTSVHNGKPRLWRLRLICSR